ncbi:MAG: lysine 6-monooxygenase, partial [Mycolicibacterium aromaticivorans]|nr:lysine 6-monooxygenase [Mycolicibacterium aromaticivorans]
QDALDLLEVRLNGPLTSDRLQQAIGDDLALSRVAPKLFLPNLSGLNQGPGFPNLSCLGLLSDRILGARPGAQLTQTNGRNVEYQSI